MANETLRVKGLDDLSAALKALPTQLARNVLRGAVRAGAEVIRKEAVARAPVYQFFPQRHPDERVDPGLLKRAIFSAHAPKRSNDTKQVYIVGVHSGRNQRHKTVKGQTVSRDAYYAAWVEFGHWYVPAQPGRLTLKARRNRARQPGGVFVPARPFMRPAFEAKRKEAIDTIERYLRRRLAKERNLMLAVARMRSERNADDSGATGLAS